MGVNLFHSSDVAVDTTASCRLYESPHVGLWASCRDPDMHTATKPAGSRIIPKASVTFCGIHVSADTQKRGNSPFLSMSCFLLRKHTLPPESRNYI